MKEETLYGEMNATGNMSREMLRNITSSVRNVKTQMQICYGLVTSPLNRDIYPFSQGGKNNLSAELQIF